jgi:hypothetical protein
MMATVSVFEGSLMVTVDFDRRAVRRPVILDVTAPLEFERIRACAPRIKSFVGKHGERSSLIFARALAASFNGSHRFVTFVLNERPADDPAEACAIVRALGHDAASLLPQLVRTYYCEHLIDYVV